MQLVVGLVDMSAWVIFKKKLQLLKSNMRVWSSTSRVQLSNKRKELQVKIKALDTSLMNDVGSNILREQPVTLLKDLANLHHLSQTELA